MIVGTAGHIDHGKTTLVAALTGVNTDRLPEEKQRGISIELGYAYLDVPGLPPGLPAPQGAPGQSDATGTPGRPVQRIGFIDVPGHERLVHTMLAGATGIDLALLLVAAHDGVMPQTREHLAVLSLLGLTRGAVVITQCDRVDAARVAAARSQTVALVGHSALDGAPVFEVSAVDGQGIAALKAWLFEQARAMAAPATPAIPKSGSPARGFRLAIDRAFTLNGVGTVVTGTVHAGQVAVGDALIVTPAAQALHTRVRSLHAQNRPVQVALAGQRCAVALVGVAKEAVARGQWLVAPALASATRRIDAHLTVWHAEAQPLRTGTRVHVHLGAATTLGTVAVLDACHQIAPGQSAPVQLVLDHTISAWRGDRVVLRDAAASRTVAGGPVLDPAGPARGRQTPARLGLLQAWAVPDLPTRLAQLLDASPMGLDLQCWARAEGLDVPRRGQAEGQNRGPGSGLGPSSIHWPTLPAHTLIASVAGLPAWALSAQAADTARAATIAALGQRHRQAPSAVGALAAHLHRLALPRLPVPLWQALLADLLARGQIAQHGPFLHLPGRGVNLSATEHRIAQKLARLLDASGLDGVKVPALARDSLEPEVLVRTTLLRLAQEGAVHALAPDLFYTTATLRQLAAVARQVSAAQGGDITAALFRDASTLGRRRVIQVLEYFDRIGLLRRVGDAHRLHRQVDLFGGTVAPP